MEYDILNGLNEEQLEAVTSTEGFIRVVAGAGSGKTRALSHRFAYLVNDIGILPGNILCVTFTNKSANEMRQRIRSLTGDNDTGFINTFHGFCVSVLKEESYAVQYPKNFLVLDNSDIDSMLKIIYEERGLTMRDMTFSMARDMIEIQKLKKKPDYYLDMTDMSIDTLRRKYDEASETNDIIFYGYLYQEKKCFGLDYNDLIKFTLHIFHEKEDIKIKWQKRLEYIMIDEFQDIDEPQYQLMETLCAYHKNLFIVGDPDQTIYTWRGANIKYLMDFDKNFRDVKTIMMMKNYRSTPQIIAASNSLIDKNKYRIKKELIPVLDNGMMVRFNHCVSAEAEAEWIAEEIENLHKEGVQYRDITVLYRAHYVSRSIEEALLKEKIPYTIYSGVQFFNRAEIKNALSYLRMIVYKDDLSFERTVNTPGRKIGQSRMKFLREYAEEHGVTLYRALCENADGDRFRGTGAKKYISLIESYAQSYEDRAVSELLSSILNESGYEEQLRTEGSGERLDNLAELKQSVYEYETSCGEESTVEHYLTNAALFTNDDTSDMRDRVKLMTVHSAKGLEFPYVFLCSMNEGMFPSRKVDTIQGMEEERRLAFVAMTRAEKGLYISEAEGSIHNGAPRYPSRFIFDIGDECMSGINNIPEGLTSASIRYIKAKSVRLRGEKSSDKMEAGTRVRHAVFGAGTIESIDNEKNAYIIKFDSIDTTRAISVKAALEVIK